MPSTPKGRAISYAEKWLMQNPDGSMRQFKRAAREAGIKGRSSALETAYREAPRARNARVGLGDGGDGCPPEVSPPASPLAGDGGDGCPRGCPHRPPTL